MSETVCEYTFGKILVAFDGSDSSEKAVHFTLEIAKKWDASLVLLTVFQKRNMPVFSSGDYDETQFDAIVFFLEQEKIKNLYKILLEETASKIQKGNPELEIMARFEEGRPSYLIVNVAEEENVDLIVVGSSGMGGIKGWILGSTSQKVVNSSTKPVLIVKCARETPV